MLIDFQGAVRSQNHADNLGSVRGRYGWIDQGTLRARVRGIMEIRKDLGPDWFDPLDKFSVRTLKGRRVQLDIDGLGRSPVRLSTNVIGDLTHEESPDRICVAFTAYSPPIIVLSLREMSDALRTPIADALEEAGKPELARIARAAAVSINGWNPVEVVEEVLDGQTSFSPLVTGDRLRCLETARDG